MLAQIPNPFSGISPPTTQQGLIGNLNTTSPGEIITKILPFVYSAAGIALLVYLVIGGFGLMFAKGDPKGIQSAQSKITNSLIGFVIVIIAYVLTSLLGQLLGLGNFGGLFK